MLTDDKALGYNAFKSAMTVERVTAKELSNSMLDCIQNAKEYGLDESRLNQGFNLLYDQKGTLPRDGQGMRYLEGLDEIRGSISRIVFGIPHKNLILREGRTWAKENLDSGVDTPVVGESVKVEPKRPSRKPQNVGILPLCIFKENAKPDAHAFDGFIGNEEAVNNIKTQLQGALTRGAPLSTVFIRGASGVGKTELVDRMSRLLGRPYCRVVASVLKSADDVHELLSALPAQTVVHIDECHTLAPEPTAVLLDVLNGTTQYKQKDFWMVFSTNLSASLPAAMKSRCMTVKLREYTVQELAQIATDKAKAEAATLGRGVADHIAERCHGIARNAVKYTGELILANPKAETIDLDMTKAYFSATGVDALGLGQEHRQYICALAKLGTASAHSLAVALGENATSEIEEAIEPLLLKKGMITISSRGRTLTPEGQRYAESLK